MFGFGTYLVGGVFEPDVWEALAVGDWELAKQRGRERKREKEREREREREEECIMIDGTHVVTGISSGKEYLHQHQQQQSTGGNR